MALPFFLVYLAKVTYIGCHIAPCLWPAGRSQRQRLNHFSELNFPTKSKTKQPTLPQSPHLSRFQLRLLTIVHSLTLAHTKKKTLFLSGCNHNNNNKHRPLNGTREGVWVRAVFVCVSFWICVPPVSPPCVSHWALNETIRLLPRSPGAPWEQYTIKLKWTLVVCGVFSGNGRRRENAKIVLFFFSLARN